MDNLKVFLSCNVIQVENIRCLYAASKRFVDDKDQPILWEIKAISSMEDEGIRNLCTKKVQVPGKPGLYTAELDTNKYMGKLAAACTVYPNLLNVELQDSYGVKGEDELLKAMLTSGEYMNYVSKVQKVNGFNEDIEELIEEAKN